MTDSFSRAKQLFELGGHLGHRKSRLHPRSRQFVYQIIDGVSIIDLEQTIEQIDVAKGVMVEAAKENKSILISATKKAVSHRAAELASSVGAHYITTKWLAGLLTNFNTISKNVKKLIELKRQKEAGEWSKYVKHETVALEKEIHKLERLYGGIVGMTKLPDLMLVIDIKREKNAVEEARKSGIPVIAIVDTNCNPDDVKYPIMLNDDTPNAVDAVLTELIEAYKKSVAVVASKEKAPETAKIENEEVKPGAEEVKVVAEKVVEEKAPPAKKKVKTTVKKPKKSKSKK